MRKPIAVVPWDYQDEDNKRYLLVFCDDGSIWHYDPDIKDCFDYIESVPETESFVADHRDRLMRNLSKAVAVSGDTSVVAAFHALEESLAHG